MRLRRPNPSPGHGTRFRIFAQSPTLASFAAPETVTVSLPPHAIRPGPSDRQIYVLRALKKDPYRCRFPHVHVAGDGRPWRGIPEAPVKPDHDGHYDHLQPDSEEFAAAAVYASARRVVDIWSAYLAGRVKWHFRSSFRRLELVPEVDDDNAHSGFGFVEFGHGTPGGRFGHPMPFWNNFDVIAHEVGHQFIYAVVGFPRDATRRRSWYRCGTREFRAFHEATADLVAIVSSLHFDSVISHLLNSTKGNLFTRNELARVGELSKSFQIRVAFNDLKMRSRAIREQRAIPHILSQPLTGAVFDILVEVFLKNLAARGFIDQGFAARALRGHAAGAAEHRAIHRGFARAFKGQEDGFAHALRDARDYLGNLMAQSWRRLEPDGLTFRAVGRALIDADRALTRGRHDQTIRGCFEWREIAVP